MVTKLCSVVLAVVTTSAAGSTVVGGVPRTVVVPGVEVTIGGLRVVDLVVTTAGLVDGVTLVVIGLVVVLSVIGILVVTLVVTGTIGVVLDIVVRVLMVVEAGVALAVDTSWVVTFSG